LPAVSPERAAVSPKLPASSVRWAKAHAGAAVSPSAPIAAALWAPEPVLGTGDGEAMRVANAQRGCAHRRQLGAAGLGRHAIAHRRRTGWLHHLHRDVFLVGRPRLEPLGGEMAAILHFDGHAVASDSSAAVVWELTEHLSGVVTVTLVGRHAHPKTGLRIRRVATLHPDDIALRNGLPVTSLARTLADRAATTTDLELENDLAEARRRHRIADDAIRAAVERARHRKGVYRLIALLDAGGEPARTRSHYERALLALVRQAGLPEPAANDDVEGHMVDLHWREHKVIVEFDSWRFHRDRAAFETDRHRDARLAAAGYVVIRITARQVEDEPYAVIARIAAALARRAAA
jgi:very-short-patch-repair endonuclease